MVAASAVLGISGFIMAFALFLSPIPMFKRILKEKNTFEFSQVSFLTQLVESFHWSLWCTTLPDRMELLYTNIVGIAIMLTYASIFMFYAQRQEGPARKVINLQAWLALFLILVGVVVFFTVESTLSQTILVSGAVFYNILKYSAPLSVAQLVISSKSVEFMPLSLTLAGLVCSSLWGLYGLVLNDYWLVVPNALGFLCSIAQGRCRIVWCVQVCNGVIVSCFHLVFTLQLCCTCGCGISTAAVAQGQKSKDLREIEMCL